MGQSNLSGSFNVVNSNTYPFVVVDLAVVAEPEVRELLHSQGLHAIQLVHNGQTVETEAAAGETIDVLEAESIRTPMRNLHSIGALNRQTLIAPK